MSEAGAPAVGGQAFKDEPALESVSQAIDSSENTQPSDIQARTVPQPQQNPVQIALKYPTFDQGLPLATGASSSVPPYAGTNLNTDNRLGSAQGSEAPQSTPMLGESGAEATPETSLGAVRLLVQFCQAFLWS